MTALFFELKLERMGAYEKEKAYELEKTIDRRLSEQQENLCRSIPMQHLECMERDLHTMLGNLRERQDWGNRYDKNTSGAGEGI